MFTPVRVYDEDVREDGTIPQYCENGPSITTYFMGCCDVRFDYANEFFAITGHMYGAKVETRIPLDKLRKFINQAIKSFEDLFEMGKFKDYRHMWE